jgi:hypothetical protein
MFTAINGSTYCATALRSAAPCVMHPSGSKKSTSNAGEEATTGTGSTQPSSLLGEKCHEAP